MIIDGSSLLYRAFYAMPPLSDSQGRPTNAVYGFLNMLLKLYADLDPYYVAVAFDKDKHTFRNELYADYKATRKPAPDELRPQFALIREVLACLGIHVLETEGYEGDDIIGTVAKQVPTDNTSVSVITGDRDALQLVDDNITVYLHRYNHRIVSRDKIHHTHYTISASHAHVFLYAIGPAFVNCDEVVFLI